MTGMGPAKKKPWVVLAVSSLSIQSHLSSVAAGASVEYMMDGCKSDPAFDNDFVCDAVDQHKISWLDSLLANRAQLAPFIIERNNWDTHSIVTEIARSLLTSLNYNVEVTTCSGNAAGYRWERIAEGLVDANMELWLESEAHMANMSEFLSCRLSDSMTNQPGVSCPVNLGPIGYEGQSGWYLPVSQVEAAGMLPIKMRFYEELRTEEVSRQLFTSSGAQKRGIADADMFKLDNCAGKDRDCMTMLKSYKVATLAVPAPCLALAASFVHKVPRTSHGTPLRIAPRATYRVTRRVLSKTKSETASST